MPEGLFYSTLDMSSGSEQTKCEGGRVGVSEERRSCVATERYQELDWYAHGKGVQRAPAETLHSRVRFL